MDKILSVSLKTGENVQLGEALSAGLKVTVVGLAIVFSVLVILMLVLMLFKAVFYKETTSSDNAEKKPLEVPVTVSQTVAQPKERLAENDELIAVITAAIAASMGGNDTKFKIKSYKRVERRRPAWGRAGISDMINSHIT